MEEEIEAAHPLAQLLMLPDPGESEDLDDPGQSGEEEEEEEGDNEHMHHGQEEERGAPARPGLKRKRPTSVSCELCKQRKVKCDRGQPSCGWCSRNGAFCEYKERKKPGLRAGYGRELEQRLDRLEEVLRTHSEILGSAQVGAGATTASSNANGVDRPLFVNSTSSPLSVSSAVMPNYAQMQHQQLGGGVRMGNAHLSSDHGTPRPRDPSGPNLFQRAMVDGLRGTTQAETALFLQKPSPTSFAQPMSSPGMGGFGLITPRPPMRDGFRSLSPLSAHGQLQAHDYFNVNSNTTTTNNINNNNNNNNTNNSNNSSSSNNNTGGLGSLNAGLSHNQRQISSDQDLPPYDLLYALVDLYFRHVNAWCPILHRKATLDALFGPAPLDEEDKMLLHGLVAVSLRFSTDARLTEDRRQHYHRVSKQHVLAHAMEHSSVATLQALVILALDVTGSGSGPASWNIMALMASMAKQLGLAAEQEGEEQQQQQQQEEDNRPLLDVAPAHTSIDKLRRVVLPEPRDFVEEESRRRLFWMVYILDRYATIPTGLGFAIEDGTIDRTLPCRDDLWTKNARVETRWFRPGAAAAAAAAAADSHETNPPQDPAGSPRHLYHHHDHHHHLLRRHHPYAHSQSSDRDHRHAANHPENIGILGFYIEILGLLTQIHTFLTKEPTDISSPSAVEAWQRRFRDLDSALTTWKFGLPGDYGNMAKVFQPSCAKTLTPGWVMLHAAYHTAVVRLHSGAAYPTHRSRFFQLPPSPPLASPRPRPPSQRQPGTAAPLFAPSHTAAQRCHAAVENVAALADFVVAQGLLPRLGPPFAYALWTAARVLLVHGCTASAALSPQIALFVNALREMGRWWPVAARYARLLAAVLDRHAAANDEVAGMAGNVVGVGGEGMDMAGAGARTLAHMRARALEMDACLKGRRGARSVDAGAASQRAMGGGIASSPTDLELLEVFDFFDVPKVKADRDMTLATLGRVQPSDAVTVLAGSADAQDSGGTTNPAEERDHAADTTMEEGSLLAAGHDSIELNITDFTMDASNDWLLKQEGANYTV